MTTNYPGGSNRDGRAGKVSYRCRNPIVELSFAKYMDKCTYLSDGTRREPDNWQKGMNLKDDMDSLLRHVEDIYALFQGYHVYKETTYINGVKNETTYYTEKPVDPLPENWHEVLTEEAVNASKFNHNIYLLDYLKAKGK